MVLGTLAADWAPNCVSIAVQWTDLTHWNSLTESNSIHNPRMISLRREVSFFTAYCMQRDGEKEGVREDDRERERERERF